MKKIMMSKKIMIPIIITILALAIMAPKLLKNDNSQEEITTSGTILGREIIVTAQVSGQIQELIKKEGDRISKDEPILFIDDTDYQLNYQKADAGLKIAQANLQEGLQGSTYEELQKAMSSIKQAESNTIGINLKIEKLLQDYQNLEKIVQAGGASQNELNNLETEIKILEEQASASKKQEESAYWQLKIMKSGARDEKIQTLEAQLQGAKSDLLLAENKIEHTKIKSPIDGRINGLFLDKGEIVVMGNPIFSVLDPQDLWVKVYIPEGEIGKIFVDQKAEITVNTFPDKVFSGRVTHISDQAQFTPKNVQTKDQRASTVFPVKITIDEGYEKLKPGITADITLSSQEKQNDEKK